MDNFLDYGYDDIVCPIDLDLPIVEEHDGIRVVRDDLLAGGTKRRAFNMYVASRPDVKEFVYASPRQGYAQLSLAYACRDMGVKCTVTVPKGKRYWLTDDAENLGCKIIEVPMGYLTNIQHKARVYCEENEAHLIPFGGDHPIIVEAMCRAGMSLDSIKHFEHPKEVWTVMSSGVLSRGLQKAWPNAKFYGVQIGHNSTEREIGRAETFHSKYKFQQECKKDERPPFPSSLTYDSKAWTFIKEHATKGALFWNVGK
jgi:hypothetical protein